MTDVINIDAVFPSLAQQAARLNSASDHVNKLLELLEQKVLELNIGVEFWYDKYIESSDAVGSHSSRGTYSIATKALGLARVDGKWCLAIKEMSVVNGFYEGDMSCPYENHLSTGSAVSLMKTPRSTRIAALQAMPDFLLALNRHLTEIVNNIESTARKFI